MAQIGMRTIAETQARVSLSEKYLQIMSKQADSEMKGQLILAKDLDKINSLTNDIEAGAERFVSGEEAYKRLARAKKLEALGVQFMEPQSESKLNLRSEKADEYFREIVESGGSPSVEEIARLARELKSAQTVSSFFKLKKFAMDRFFQEQGKTQDYYEKEANYSDHLRDTITFLNKGQVEKAYAELEKIHFTESEFDMPMQNKKQIEKRINKIKFLIECHVFAGRFNAKLVNDLRTDYAQSLVPNKK